MKEIKYSLKGVEGEPSEFEGEVVVKLPNYEERIDLVIQLKTQVKPASEDGLVIDTLNETLEKLHMAKKLRSIVGSHVVSLELLHKPTGEVFKSVEDLDYCSNANSVFSELGSLLTNGIKLGKP